MRLIFKYDLNKEWDNLLRGLGSKNHPGELPAIVLEMQKDGIDLKNKNDVLVFFRNKLSENKIDIDREIEQSEFNWTKISKEAEKRFKNIFSTDLDLGDITVYLTLNRRCGYNVDKKYFFVSFLKNNKNATIIHELLHFYTYKLLLKDFIDQGINRNDFNDYKEALTFLMNTNFQDLLEGFEDQGYPKQAKLRKFLILTWPKCKNVSDLTELTIKKYFKNKKQ